MKSVKKILGFGLLGAVAVAAAGCGATAYSSGSAALGDDMYGTHDINGMAERERRQAELQKAQYEAREAKFRAEAAEYEARMAQQAAMSYKSDDGDGYLETTYEGAYARRLRGFESEEYRPAQSYYDYEVYRYSPDGYNLMVSGNQVWVEPKYVTAFFGTWGAAQIGTRLVVSSYANPYDYAAYWGYGWAPPYVGWDSYYVWNYPTGYRYGWCDPYYARFGWYGNYNGWCGYPYYGWNYPYWNDYGYGWGRYGHRDDIVHSPAYGGRHGQPRGTYTGRVNNGGGPASPRGTYSNGSYRQGTNTGGGNRGSYTGSARPSGSSQPAVTTGSGTSRSGSGSTPTVTRSRSGQDSSGSGSSTSRSSSSSSSSSGSSYSGGSTSSPSYSGGSSGGGSYGGGSRGGSSAPSGGSRNR